MSTALYDSISRIARHEVRSRPVAAIARVTELFEKAGPDTDYAVSVELRDTGLVLPRVPVATGVSGMAALPAVEDLVVVLFAEGDYHAPVVVGRLHSPGVPAPEHRSGEIVLQLPAGSKSDDAKLDLNIKGDTPQIRLRLGSDITVQLDGEQVLIEAGDMKVALTTAGGGSAEVAAGEATITMKASGDVSVKASNKLVLEASQIEIKGNATVKIQGGTVDIN